MSADIVDLFPTQRPRRGFTGIGAAADAVVARITPPAIATTAGTDLLAFAGTTTGGGDTEVLALFHRWIDESRVADKTPDSDEDG